MPPKELPTVASFWDGAELGWIERACLASFVDVGHPVILYSYEQIENLPDGIKNLAASEVWEAPSNIRNETSASYVADIFRIHLMDRTDFIWVDTDVIAFKPLIPNKDGFLVGYTPWEAEINNCIMRLPKNSKTLAQYRKLLSDMSIVPPWMRPALRQRLEKTPIEQREVARFHTLRTIIGPRALTYYLKQSGEDRHALSSDVLSPVPWQLVDVIFNRYGGWKGWITDDTCALHLWSNVLRHHKKRSPDPDSLIGQQLARLGSKGP